MIHEVIVVEGKSDIAAVKRAIEADCIATEGFTLRSGILKQIHVAYEKRGIIILTDPDNAGEKIRRLLSKQFPNAKHAFVPRDEATANDDIGIEQASSEAIRKALAKVHTITRSSSEEFSVADLFRAGLNGYPDSAKERAIVGAKLGIGYGNAKQFLHRLNFYGITREEFEAVVRSNNLEKP